MSTLPRGQKLLAILPAVIVIFLLTPHPLHAQYVTTTVPAGTNPWAVAVNPVTNKIYVANYSTNNVTVIDGATNATITVTDPAAISPYAVAVDTMTNKIYVSNCGTCTSSTGHGSGSVTVIDGATNATTNLGLGFNPWALAINPVTNKIYVANCGNCGGGTGKGDVMVIDGTTNKTTTITDPKANGPTAVAVNPATNKIYVANEYSNTVSVINGATNGITSVAVGISPGHIAVNPVTNKIYVANGGSGTVTVINGATNSKATVTTGGVPASVAINPVSNKIYVANCGVCTGGKNIVTVIDGTTNAATAVSSGVDPWDVAVNPVTNKVYVSNNAGTVTLIDGATNTTTTLTDPNAINPYAVAVNPVTNKIYVGNELSANVTVIDGATNATTTIPGVSGAVAINPVTNKIYVAGSPVAVIDGATNSITAIPGASGGAVAVNPVTNKIYVAGSPVTVVDGGTNSVTTIPNASGNAVGVAVNPVTNKIYVTNGASNTLTVIDGPTNAITEISMGPFPSAVGVNPVTNKIYVVNCDDSLFCGTGDEGLTNVTVIDGYTNSVTAVISAPGWYDMYWDLAVNPLTNKIYVADENASEVLVIDGATNATITIPSNGMYSFAVAVNAVTNKIYVANFWSGNVTVIDGATDNETSVTAVSPWDVAVNPVTNKIYAANCGSFENWCSGSGSVTVIDGATNSTTTVTDPNVLHPYKVAVNPVTNKIYVVDKVTPNVTVVDEEEVHPIPLVTAITPLAGNQTVNPAPTFSFSASSSFSPTAPSPQAVWYQVDTWQGAWLPTSGTAPNFSATTPSLPLGTHILYAFATDGQDASSTGVAQPLIGSMAAYVFEVVLPATSTALTSSPNPSVYSRPATFTATVRVNPPGSRTPTGTVSFYADGGYLGTATLTSTGQAVYTTTALLGGSHSITASYSGDTNFLDSSSAVLTEQVNPAPTTITLISVPNPSGHGQAVTFAATVNPPGSGTPTGTVSFYDGSTLLGTATPGSTGQAAFTTSVLSIGSHSITASYSGDTNFKGSTSPVLIQQVNPAPLAALSPTSLNFGNQVINTTSATKIVRLTNVGELTLDISSITPSTNFAVSSTTCGATLAVSKHCDVYLTFTPPVLGKLTGTLTFSDNAPEGPETVALSGVGVEPATLTPATYAYPAQAVSTVSALKTFTLTNYQTVTLNNIVISTTGDFTVSSTTCTTSLPAKGKCTISVTFMPTALGTRTGQLSVSDDASNSPQTSALRGTGVLPATLTPATFDYPAQVLGTTSAPKAFTLTNNESVTLNNIVISATGDFGVSSTTCTTNLAAKSHCTISVTFAPTARGTRTGQLIVNDDASNRPQSSNLRGAGT